MARKPRAKVTELASTVSDSVSVPIATAPKALVFLSHDARDADLAEAFADLVADVSAGTVKSFRSSDNKGTSGIEFGENWYTAILAKLGEATELREADHVGRGDRLLQPLGHADLEVVEE